MHTQNTIVGERVPPKGVWLIYDPYSDQVQADSITEFPDWHNLDLITVNRF